MNENESMVNVNDLRKGDVVKIYGGWVTLDHICHGPRGDSRWLCTEFRCRATHRWSRESVLVRKVA